VLGAQVQALDDGARLPGNVEAAHDIDRATDARGRHLTSSGRRLRKGLPTPRSDAGQWETRRGHAGGPAVGARVSGGGGGLAGRRGGV
jgi:hypothetical protein